MRRDPLRRVSAGGEKAGLWPSASLLYCCRNLSLAHHFVMARRSGELIFVGGSRSSFSFHFLRSENKYFPNDMSYDFFFSCSNTNSGKIHFHQPLLDVSSSDGPSFHSEGSDGWGPTTGRILHQLKLRLATLSGGSAAEGGA